MTLPTKLDPLLRAAVAAALIHALACTPTELTVGQEPPLADDGGDAVGGDAPAAADAADATMTDGSAQLDAGATEEADANALPPYSPPSGAVQVCLEADPPYPLPPGRTETLLTFAGVVVKQGRNTNPPGPPMRKGDITFCQNGVERELLEIKDDGGRLWRLELRVVVRDREVTANTRPLLGARVSVRFRAPLGFGITNGFVLTDAAGLALAVQDGYALKDEDHPGLTVSSGRTLGLEKNDCGLYRHAAVVFTSAATTLEVTPGVTGGLRLGSAVYSARDIANLAPEQVVCTDQAPVLSYTVWRDDLERAPADPVACEHPARDAEDRRHVAKSLEIAAKGDPERRVKTTVRVEDGAQDAVAARVQAAGGDSERFGQIPFVSATIKVGLIAELLCWPGVVAVDVQDPFWDVIPPPWDPTTVGTSECPRSGATCPAYCEPVHGQRFDPTLRCLRPQEMVTCVKEGTPVPPPDIRCKTHVPTGTMFAFGGYKPNEPMFRGWDGCTDSDTSRVVSAPPCR